MVVRVGDVDVAVERGILAKILGETVDLKHRIQGSNKNGTPRNKQGAYPSTRFLALGTKTRQEVYSSKADNSS